MDATAQTVGLQRRGGGVQLQQPGAQLTVSRSRRSLDLRVQDGRAPSHPTESGDSAGTPRRALKPASRGPTPRRRPRDHDAGTPQDCAPGGANLSLAAPVLAANLGRTVESATPSL